MYDVRETNGVLLHLWRKLNISMNCDDNMMQVIFSGIAEFAYFT